MKGKVKCTCGWSWNKSDSSVKDMYICHECGRDNSNNMKNGGWLDSYGKAQDGEALYTPPKSQYKRLYGHAKDYSLGENEKMRIDPNTGYSYFPQETSLSQEKEVPNSPWNVSRFLFDPFILNASQGVHNSKYDKEGKLINLPGDGMEEGRLANNLSRRERYNAAKEDITNYYKEDLKQNDADVEKKVDDTMDLIRKMRRTEEMMQRHNSTYKDFQNYDPQEVFKSAVGFDELFPQKSILGDKNLSPAQAKRAYKMFQKTWRGVSGKEARQNAREELRKAEEAFKLAKEQKKQGLNKSNSSYKSNSDYDPEAQFYFDNYGTTLASAKLYDPEKPSTSIPNEKEIVKSTKYYNTDPKRGKVETPGNEEGVRYIPISNSIQLEKWKEQQDKLKNGGWLDSYADGGTMQEHQENYNNSQASAPEGMIGDGFSNVGRNYSPAWGGQFQEGGEIPMAQKGKKVKYVESENDPSYQAFRDSTALRTIQEKILNEYNKSRKPGYKFTPDKTPLSKLSINEKDMPAYENSKLKKLRQEQDKIAKRTGYKPIGQQTYTDEKMVNEFESPGLIESFSSLFKPSPKETMKDVYSFTDDVYKKPELEVIVKPTTTKETTKPKSNYWTSKDVSADAWEKFIKQHPGAIGMDPDNVDKDGYHLPIYADKQRPKVEALQPLTQQGAVSDFSIDAQLPVIRPEAKMPKSFDVNSQRQTMSGPSEYYNYSDEGVDFSDALRAKESADAYNQYVKEKYEEAAKTNPKAQKRLEQLMQNVELTPNYQMGGNVYPVNYVPQAQEGKTMFKKPSILQQEYIDPIYSYSERTKLYPGEEKTFKERLDVAGMAGEDNRVIINPYSPISKEMKDLVRTNETARLAMRNGYPRPDFELTPKQQEFFSTIQNGKPYSEDLQDIKETIAARVMTGDDSAQDYTKEQEMYADKLFDVLKKSKEYATGMSGMMKSKIGMGNAFEHPAIKRMSQAIPKTGMTPEGIGTHYMSSVDNYAVPELQDLGEEELTLVDPDPRSREAIRFNSPEEANYFAKNYKDVAPMTNIFGDLNSFKAGGSIPGTPGFTYARTKGIPSNGPYAKKTMASAQNGVDMYDNPLIARMVNNANIDRSYYDPRLNTINMGSDYNMWRDEETGEPLTGDDLKYQQDKMLAHENYHAMQHKEGRDNYDIAHSTDNEQWARMQKRPEVMSTDAVWNNFYNRSAIENIQDYANKINEVPEARLINQQLLFDKVLDRERYNNPSNLEGEAKFYEDTGVTFQNGGEMKYYQEGLDWKPKTISKNGGWLSKYEEGEVIKDDRGQWAYPGEITEINSNDITMEGVPYDVLGISDTGDTKLMKPGKNYKFKGKKVTEFPMAKNGLRQEQKGLVNLDNLLNFTNYNKPQPGGWLSKYE